MGLEKKGGNSTTQVLRKSRRLQQASDNPNGGNIALPIEYATNHVEGPTMVAQPSELPLSPIDGCTSIPNKKSVRGLTRGINMDKIRKKLGHPIPIQIDDVFMDYIRTNFSMSLVG